MPLSSAQREALVAEANRQGIDSAKLLELAERTSGEGKSSKEGGDAPSKEKPALYMYLLPFVTVNEVRTIWLELDPVSGGDEYAGAWAAKQSGNGGGTPSAAE